MALLRKRRDRCSKKQTLSHARVVRLLPRLSLWPSHRNEGDETQVPGLWARACDRMARRATM